MANNFWTPSEDSFLRRNAHKMDAGQLAKHMDRTQSAIAARASLLNIKIRSVAEARRASSYYDPAFDEYEQAGKEQVRAACRAHLEDLRAAYRSPASALVEG